MDINMNDPNWRSIFRLISESQLAMLQKSLDKESPAVTRRDLQKLQDSPDLP